MITLLASFALALVPQPGELRTFQDWTVGCDNGGACQAVSLADMAAERWQTLSLRRGPKGAAEPVLSLSSVDPGDTCGATFVADGARLPVRLIAAQTCIIVHPADAPALLAALRTARTLRLIGAGGEDLGAVSLAGAAAAMLYIDEAQRRLGTETALMRRGARPASTVPAPPALPEVRLAPAPDGDAPEVDTARIADLRREAGCTIDEVGGPDQAAVSPLAPGKSLVLLACGTGAYNVTQIPYVARREADGDIVIAIARFDRQWAVEERQRPELINAEWDASARLLREFPRGRGLGDCGTRSAYAWDGDRFRLVFQSAMGECRGAYDYITTWRVRVVGR